jgi:hypothetical protein
MSTRRKDWPPKENWISDGNEIPIQEGFLVGDRKGFETLHRAIQKALESADGKAGIEELRSQWSHVSIREKHPEEEQKDFESTTKGKIGKIFGLCVIGMMIFLMIYGCIQLPRLFK